MTDALPHPAAVGLPFAYAKRFGVLLQAGDARGAQVAYREGIAIDTLIELRRHIGAPVVLQAVDGATFDRLLSAHYEQNSGQALQQADEIGEDLDLFSVAGLLPEPDDLLDSANEAPIIRLLNALLVQAVRDNASDIHIEPFETRLAIRFRVDGMLREVLQPRRELAPLIVSRVKVMARLDIAERRLPQDGRISLRIGGRPVDVRVSTIPSGAGERVVLRLLDKQAGRLALDRLGLTREALLNLESLITRPHGIVLVTGPTGSGKTTTLYGVLSRLNDRTRNILTVEDPIEYYLDGIGQTQVNVKIDMSFARGLRAILRQDPDVVMVGEIRDLETAQIAVQASLTGHLVLSTLHTNTAVGAVTRLRDMGVEPFLLASSLVGIVAQRLVRVLCPHCRAPYRPNSAELAALDVEPPDRAYTFCRPVGCPHCKDAGYLGRTGIFEVVAIDDALKEMIHSGSSELDLEAHARRHSAAIRDDGLRRVLDGTTSPEELLRVTRAA